MLTSRPAISRCSALQRQGYYYRKLQELVLKELPYIPLWYEDQVYVTRKNIHHYRLFRDGNYDGLVTVTRGQGAREIRQ